MSGSIHILFLGKRLDALKAAKKLGYTFSVVHDKKITKPKKYIEIQVEEEKSFPKELLKSISNKITHIIPTTEYGVRILSKVMGVLNLSNSITSNVEPCYNKLLMKELANRNQIGTAEYLFVKKWEPDQLIKALGTDLIIKDIASSGSRKQFLLNSSKGIRNAQFENVLVERRIFGHEFSIESFVKNGKVIFANATTYHKHHISNILPYLPPWINEAFNLNQKIIEVFGIKNSLTHIEFYKTKEQILFGEIAIRPPGGYIMQMIDAAYNISSWEMFIRIHLGQEITLPTRAEFNTACWILYPTVNELTQVPSFDFLKDDSSFLELKCSLKKGVIEKRMGSGEDFGRILLKNKDLERLTKSLNKIEKNLRYK